MKQHCTHFHSSNFSFYIFAPAFFLLLISCEGTNKNDTSDMAGAYSMYRQIINDGTKDSILDRNQLKIYTDKHIMYASASDADSMANYGVGTYEVKDDKIYEYIYVRSSEGTIVNKRDTAVLSIEPSSTGYMQVIEEIELRGTNYKLSEQYDNVSKPVTSPLDGAWKQIINYYIDATGDTTTVTNPVQYKMFQSGYFIWALTYKDSANKDASVFGYGTFEMDGKTKCRETTLNSTFRTALMGRTSELALEFDGKDKYKQTIEFRTGQKSIELYERMK